MCSKLLSDSLICFDEAHEHGEILYNNASREFALPLFTHGKRDGVLQDFIASCLGEKKRQFQHDY